MNIGKIGSEAIGVVQNTAQKAIAKISKEVPKSEFTPQCWSYTMPYEVYTAKKNRYVQKLYETYFDKDGKVIPEIKKFLDETVFDMKIGGGKTEKCVSSTIKNHISSSIHDIETINEELFHGALYPDLILENGFDPKFIVRTHLGPGFYFSGEGEAREYGSVIAAKIRNEGAKCAKADDRFYEGVSSGKTAQKLSGFLGFDSSKYSEETRLQQEFIPKIINEYSRDFIVNELGIDVLRGYGGATPFDYCTCVLNPKIFESVYAH